MGWDDAGIDAIVWTQLKVALAGAIGASVIAHKGDIAFIIVIAWAAFGISVQQAETPAVAGAAICLAVLAVMLASFESFRQVYFKQV